MTNKNQKFTLLSLFILIFCNCLLSFKALALVELAGHFSYSKQVYGDLKQISSVDRTYSTSMTVYFFEMTGIEFNYSYADNITTDNTRLLLLSDVYIVSVQNRVNTKTSGIGIRQALLPLNSRIVPSLSAGLARQIKRSETDYTYEYSSLYSISSYRSPKASSEAMFGSFNLKIAITKLFNISGSIRTVFEARKYNEAKNNLFYEAGLSWLL